MIFFQMMKLPIFIFWMYNNRSFLFNLTFSWEGAAATESHSNSLEKIINQLLLCEQFKLSHGEFVGLVALRFKNRSNSPAIGGKEIDAI